MKLNLHPVLNVFLVCSVTCASADRVLAQKQVPVVGGPCEGCEAVFEGLPEELSSTARIAPVGEKGAPLSISGVVTDAEGRAAAGIIVYAYQTNSEGVYPVEETRRGRARHRHGMLRGWAVTDTNGRYQFGTIRPGGYPGSDTPAHVHMHVIEPGRCTYWIDDIRFADDPRLADVDRDALTSGRGGSGLVVPRCDDDGVWHAQRDVVLGEGISDYPRSD